MRGRAAAGTAARPLKRAEQPDPGLSRESVEQAEERTRLLVSKDPGRVTPASDRISDRPSAWSPRTHRRVWDLVRSLILDRRPGRARLAPTTRKGIMAETVAHVVGARPNFMKAAPVIRALDARHVPQVVIHTGQHYDEKMSEVFFRDLGLPEPDLNLGVGSGSHAVQTAAIMVELEKAFLALDPALVVVYGDVNSTLAAAVVASKIGRPLAHVEAGLRSFDRTMPEEVNRVVTDVLADLLFTTSPEAAANLAREGVDPSRVHFVGNPMIDTLLANLDRFDVAAARARHDLDGPYGVATLHRPANVDDPATARRIVAAVRGVAELVPLVIPLHPRGRATLEAAGLGDDPRVRVVDPLGYVDFLSLVRGAALVVTDSGGIQEETTVLGVPCLTLRPNTERPITISHGTNRLVEPEDVVAAARAVLDGSVVRPDEPPPLWDGAAGERIAAIVERWLAAPAAVG
jgi:UDP-N-acetylglucosamine 2-epimerase (non-hydrolysing)